MRFLSTKSIVATVVILVALGVGLFVILNNKSKDVLPTKVVKELGNPVYKIIGESVRGRKIESYTYGKGATKLLFVGGMHGGYEWNSAFLAYQFMDFLKENPDTIPNNLKITVIPSLNPDGVYEVTGKEGRFALSDVSTDKVILATGRFNAREVDLNRNFDCKWKPTGTWQSKTVSAGETAFSEPETIALKNFVLENKPNAVIFWHSQANAVYASECEKGILPQTLDIMEAYSKASGYPAIKSFDAYPVTGDSEGWLASMNIPTITVELKTHDAVEWEKNLAGIKALFTYYTSDSIE